jgi:hypothetical protein
MQAVRGQTGHRADIAEWPSVTRSGHEAVRNPASQQSPGVLRYAILSVVNGGTLRFGARFGGIPKRNH